MTFNLLQAENNCSIINSRNIVDEKSIDKALSLLKRQTKHKNKYLVIYDLCGNNQKLYEQIHTKFTESAINKIVIIGVKPRKDFILNSLEFQYFSSAEQFIDHWETNEFEDADIMFLSFSEGNLAKIIQKLQKQSQLTTLEIDLDAIGKNLKYFRTLLDANTKIMAMVKAFSYGSGCYEIANFLEYQNVDYLGVAIADEGVRLRQAGVKLPIIVMNPNRFSFDRIIKYELEPEIYNIEILNDFNNEVQKAGLNSYPIHIKVDTGMKRLGFDADNLDILLQNLPAARFVRPISVFSHLVGSSEPQLHHDFTLLQINKFNLAYQKIQNLYEYKLMRHILNSGGIENYPQAQYDMVRLGIGLYGVSAKREVELSNISRLKTSILHIQNVKKNESIGYDRAAVVQKDSRIAIIPIGYADGYNRRFGNGVGKVVIKGKLAPIIGNVCMDICMVDISGIEAAVGDEVEVFGNTLSIKYLADKIQTIPYEILSSVPSRIKHVYLTSE